MSRRKGSKNKTHEEQAREGALDAWWWIYNKEVKRLGKDFNRQDFEDKYGIMTEWGLL